MRRLYNLRQRAAEAVLGLSIRLTRRHRRVTGDDLAEHDVSGNPRPRMNDQLRDRMRARWLRFRK